MVESDSSGMGGASADPVDEVVRNHHLFRSLDEAAKAEIRAIAAAASFGPDDIVFNEGEEGDAFFILTTGSVEVTTTSKGHPMILGVLKSGAFVGEVGSLSGRPRTATVRAINEVHAICFQREKLMAILGRFPKAIELLGTVARARAENTISKMSR